MDEHLATGCVHSVPNTEQVVGDANAAHNRFHNTQPSLLLHKVVLGGGEHQTMVLRLNIW